MTDRIKFTVWRDKWLRGGSLDGCLLSSMNGCRCCLGHLARDVGIEDEALEDVAMPGDVSSRLWPTPLTINTSGSLAWDAAKVNDDPHLDDAERERRLTERFALDGIDVEFRDGAGPEST